MQTTATNTTSQGYANRVVRTPIARRRSAARTSATRRRASPRARVAAAFRKMARGVQDKAAYASTVAFYRSSGHAWTRQLG